MEATWQQNPSRLQLKCPSKTTEGAEEGAQRVKELAQWISPDRSSFQMLTRGPSTLKHNVGTEDEKAEHI